MKKRAVPPRRGAGAPGPPEGSGELVRGGLVGAGAELDLDVGRGAGAAGLERHLVARLVAVDRVPQRVGAGDRAAVDRGDDVAAAQAGVGGGAAAGDLADRDAGARRGVGQLHAEVGVGDLAPGDQLLGDALHDARRDREADAVVAAGVALDLRVDADDVAGRVEQRATRVAVVDRGVGLDRARDREVVRRVDRPVEGTDDAGRHGSLEAERAADGDDAVADLHVVRVGERDRVQLQLRRVDLDDRDIGRAVGADDLRARGLGVGERDLDRRRAVDDVLVRGDVAVGVDHEARALGLRLLPAAVAAVARTAEARRRRAGGRAHLDVDDAVLRLLVDLVDRDAAGRVV